MSTCVFVCLLSLVYLFISLWLRFEDKTGKIQSLGCASETVQSAAPLLTVALFLCRCVPHNNKIMPLSYFCGYQKSNPMDVVAPHLLLYFLLLLCVLWCAQRKCFWNDTHKDKHISARTYQWVCPHQCALVLSLLTHCSLGMAAQFVILKRDLLKAQMCNGCVFKYMEVQYTLLLCF